MAHIRKRLITGILQKRMMLWPIVGVLGPRQAGKTTLLRDILSSGLNSRYVTLDSKTLRDQAQKAPELFLSAEAEDSKTLIIDEVQKAPDLFDALKAEVDRRRRPSRFVLSGSTQFSQKIGIRESLTGRIGLFHLYPMILAELYSHELGKCWSDLKFKPRYSLREIKEYTEKGGLPGICFLRSSEERRASFESWIDTTCFRDLFQIKGRRLNGELAKEILLVLPTLEKSTAGEISRRLKKDIRIIKNHLEALELLFVIRRLNSHSNGVGSAQYLLFDSGLNHYLQGSLLSNLRISLINEIEAQFSYTGSPLPQVSYFLSRNKSSIDLVIETRDKKTFGILIIDEATPSPYTLRTVTAFQKTMKGCQVYVLAPSDEVVKLGKSVTLIPWTAID